MERSRATLAKTDAAAMEALVASPETLKQRIGADVARGLRTWDVLDRSLDRLPLYQNLDTEKLWVDRLTPQEAARILAEGN